MTTVYLLRHGEYENPRYLFPGRDPGYPLSVTGREQVERTTAKLAFGKIAALYASPLLRTKQTADILAKKLDLPVIYDDRLLEVRTGMENTPMKEFDAIGGNVYTPEFARKGVEQPEAIAARMRTCITALTGLHAGKTIVCVSHGDPIRFAVASYSGLPLSFDGAKALRIPLAGGYRLDFEAGEDDVKLYPIVAS